ncbi:MAG: transposase [Terriglobia bacterium]
MAVPKRHGRITGTYFITSRTWQSRALFKQEAACRIFVETLYRYRAEHAYKLHGFVPMPEHFHVLITPETGVTVERAVQYIKGGSARRIGKELNFRFPVWQRGFSDHRIRDAEDYERHLRYIEMNPVKRGLCSKPEEYPWSSASGQFGLDEPPQGLKPRGKEAAVRHG